MPDTRALREEQRAKDLAWAAALEDARKKGMSGDLIPRCLFFDAGFIAGLRYRDEAEPSEARVEAAARAICDLSDDGEKWEDFLPESPVREDCRMEARAALEAARKASP